MPTARATLGSIDFEVTATIRNHKVTFDEPVDLGGKNKGPGSTEMLCASLAACTTATLKMYINHKKLTVEGITVEVDKSNNAEGKNVFTRTIHIKGNFDADQQSRLLAIANKCPVHKILEGGNNVIETSLS